MNDYDTADRLTGIRGVLFDLGGVLYVDDTVVEGAVTAVEAIKAQGLRCRFVTNTSTHCRDSLLAKLRSFGFPVEAGEIFSAPRAAARIIENGPDMTCHLLVAHDARQEFVGLRQAPLEDADWIVLGDIGNAWSYELLNAIFRRLMAGAQLLAIHRNRYWETSAGLSMDLGGFVAALEYCSGSKALVVGKPSVDFFRIALDDMQLDARQAVMVGDDIEADVEGGQRAGLLGVLVRTGKYRRAVAEASTVRPDRIIDSVADLPALLFAARSRV